jgi:hypothetical protein
MAATCRRRLLGYLPQQGPGTLAAPKCCSTLQPALPIRRPQRGDKTCILLATKSQAYAAAASSPAIEPSSGGEAAAAFPAHATWLRQGGADAPGSPFAPLGLQLPELEFVSAPSPAFQSEHALLHINSYYLN